MSANQRDAALIVRLSFPASAVLIVSLSALRMTFPGSFRVLCGSGYKLAVRRRWRESLSRVDQRGCRRGIFEGMAQVSKAIPAKKQPLVKSLHQRPDAPWRTRDRDIPRWVASPQSPTPFLPLG